MFRKSQGSKNTRNTKRNYFKFVIIKGRDYKLQNSLQMELDAEITSF